VQVPVQDGAARRRRERRGGVEERVGGGVVDPLAGLGELVGPGTGQGDAVGHVGAAHRIRRESLAHLGGEDRGVQRTQELAERGPDGGAILERQARRHESHPREVGRAEPRPREPERRRAHVERDRDR